MNRFRFLSVLLTALLLTGPRALAQRPQGSSPDFTDILSVNSDLVALTDNGEIHRSTDGGETYAQIHDVSPDQLFGIAANADIVIAVGTDGLTYRADFSVNPGVWTEIAHGLASIGDLRGIDSRASGVWIAVGDDVLRSGDNGLTWTSPASLSGLQAVTHVAGDVWVAVGSSGISGAVYRSTDNGFNWDPVGLPAFTGPLLAVAGDGFGNVLAVGEAGVMLLSENNGASFAALGSGVSQDLTAIVATGDNLFLIGGDERSLISSDDGTQSVVIEPSEGFEENGAGLALLNGAVVMAGVEAVAPPTILPQPADPGEPVQIVLTPGVDSTSTHYTTDGSDPDLGDTEYSTPFWITSDTTVKAVSVRNGVHSPIVSEFVEADLVLYELGIAVSGANLLITLSDSLDGQPYQLQFCTNLAAVPQVWTNEQAPLAGDGDSIQWTITPIPAGPRAWRAVLP